MKVARWIPTLCIGASLFDWCTESYLQAFLMLVLSGVVLLGLIEQNTRKDDA